MTPFQIYNLIIDHSLIIVTDSRKIIPGCFFVAIVGEKFDGNDFAETALEQGAAFALVSNQQFSGNEKMIVVDDTLQTLQQIAKIHRETFSIPVIVIGGSNGKTTTKELVAIVLSKKYRVHVTAGNLNNHIGVPLTLLAMPRDTQIAIIEIGANHIGEHTELLEIIQPTYVLVTNNGQDHLEGFGSMEGVRTANGEVFVWAKKNGAKIFVNKYIPDLVADSDGGDVILYPEKTYQSQSTEFAGCLYDGVAITSQLFGSLNENNILAAIAIGEFFRVPIDNIADAIQSYEPNLKRSQVIKKADHIIIMDCYNANPSSMELALSDLYNTYPDKKKIVVIGDMFEMGDESPKYHKELLELVQLKQKQSDSIICVGRKMNEWNNQFPFHFFENTETAKEFLNTLDKTDTVIFLKASRGIQLENILG